MAYAVMFQKIDPLSRGSVVLGGRGSHSEARWGRHASTYQADVSGIDRFAIPANNCASDDSWQEYRCEHS